MKDKTLTKCEVHPDRTDHLFYCYPFPTALLHPWAGMVLCPECREKYEAKNWDFFKSAIRAGGLNA